jgi:hypothetical protein
MQSYRNSQKPTSQLGLFNPIAQPEAPKLSIDSVPRDLAIAPNRFYITVRHYKHCWYYPLQLSEVEARWIYPKVKDLNWSLNSNGVPVESAPIHQIVELLIDGGAKA